MARRLRGAARRSSSALRDEGAKAIEEARAKGEKLLVIVGRPYNIYDSGLNLDLPEKLAEQGRTVLPMDFLTLDLARLGERYRNTYWGYGQKILAALEDVAHNDLLDAVYFTNFSCGPDSFLLTYASEIMGNKPFLALELDEHGSDTGYLTRIEAFFDVLRRPRKSNAGAAPVRGAVRREINGRRLWIPDMHPFATELAAAALRGQRLRRARAAARKPSRPSSWAGRVTRGSECLPTALTIGSLLDGDARRRRRTRSTPSSWRRRRARAGSASTSRCTGRSSTARGSPTCRSWRPRATWATRASTSRCRRQIFKAMLVGDILMKAGCKVRPYELEAGETNYRLEQENGAPGVGLREPDGDLVTKAVGESIRRIASVPQTGGPRKPLVGIVGEIYVRNNVFANEHVVRSIEKLGAEAWMAPLTEWVLFTSSMWNVRAEPRPEVLEGARLDAA